MIRSAVERLTVLATGPENFGGGPEIRTLQSRVWNPVLSQSSLSPVVRLLGFEPATRRMVPEERFELITVQFLRLTPPASWATRAHSGLSKIWRGLTASGHGCIHGAVTRGRLEPAALSRAQPTFRGFYRDQ